MANDTPFGLAAYFYARDIGRVWRVAEALECGIIGINEGIISTEVAPFGGVKESGLGREGSHHGVEEYPGDEVHADGRAVRPSLDSSPRAWPTAPRHLRGERDSERSRMSADDYGSSRRPSARWSSSRTA